MSANRDGHFLGYTISLGEVNPWRDLIICELGDCGFDMFEDTSSGFVAWGKEEAIDEDGARRILESYEDKTTILLHVERTPVENWNKEWEKNFDPVEIADFLRIKAPFHEAKQGFRYTLTISPKMAFGTGHHATTLGMCKLMEKMDFTRKRVLDMGCGTGVLGILALKMGAKTAAGIDIDPWAIENSLENAELNSVAMSVTQGDAENINGKFDVILANIQRNVLIQDIPIYVRHLEKGGSLLISGFYESDEANIHSLCAAYHLILADRFSHNSWVALHYQYKA
ncbi:MAG: 50S ribosomal protein L11 methyltransferase [Thermaurantimonas sp.]